MLRMTGRPAVTTMRPVPDARSGTVCLPISCVMRTLSLPSWAICALPGSSRLKSGVTLPFCSNATRIGFISAASGAVMVIWSGVAVPTNFSGFSMVMAGGAIRPATTQAPPAATRRMRTRPTRYFIQ